MKQKLGIKENKRISFLFYLVNKCLLRVKHSHKKKKSNKLKY